MNATNRIRAELAHWQETGELPAAWEPEPTEAPEIDDARLDEMMREREAIESGCVEPPPLGWLCQLSRYGER
jgi:hypothetical protein